MSDLAIESMGRLGPIVLVSIKSSMNPIVSV